MFLKFLRMMTVAVVVANFFMSQTFALKLRSAKITIPKQCKLSADLPIKIVKEQNGSYRLYFREDTVFPIEIKITDLFGAHFSLLVKDPSQINGLIIEEDIVANSKANPIEIYRIPRLCPRSRLSQIKGKMGLVYDTRYDVLNGKPKLQMFDPDYKRNSNQRKILDHFDNQNVLALNRVKLSYDYEDSNILDYFGPHPITKKPHLVYEGEGGFYANLHYAVVPYDPRILKLDRQELLNLAQGKLQNINRHDLTPKMRTHAFIPGPYLSGHKIYQMCEWGDTAFQAKEQEMRYKNLTMWDWDLLSSKSGDGEKVIIIVWEGDEEDWLIADGLLDPYYLTDDLVGIFVVDRKKTLKPLVLKNEAGDFEMEIETEF